MSTSLVQDPELIVSHHVVEPPVSQRKRLLRGAGLIVTGIVIFLAWGMGAKNGDAAFQVSQAFDKYQIPVVRFPGGGAAMVMGVMVAALGVGEIVIGYRRTWWRTAVSVSALLFVLAFLCWMATGNPDNPLGITGMVQQTIVSAIPFILGALAGIICERSGVINVAIEGQMLLGAFAGALFASSASNLGIGVVAAMLGGAVIAVLLAVFAIRYLVNQVVLGVVLNAFALGLTNLGYQSIMQSDPNSYNAGNTLSPIKIPLLGDIPVIGTALFDVNIISYLTYALVIVVDIGLFRTRWGLRTRAVGEHPRAADTVGIKVRGHPLPQRDHRRADRGPGRGGTHRRRLGRVQRQHLLRQGFHRPRRGDLRTVEPARRDRGGPAVRVHRRVADAGHRGDPAGHHPLGVPEHGPLRGHRHRRGRLRRTGAGSCCRRRAVREGIATMTREIDWPALRRAALEAMGNAYAPYSQFPVGAAALVDDGRIVVGCNVENASYGVGLCAECGLVSSLHATGGGSLVAFACVDFHGSVLMPCGRCRQLLWEHGGPDLLVDTAEGPITMLDVLPLAFGREHLG